MKLESYLDKIQYRITGGSEFWWDCYGPNAWSIEGHNTDAVFDRVTQMVYEVSLTCNDGKCYKWVDPDFVDRYVQESKNRGFDPWIAYDDVSFHVENDKNKILSLLNNLRETTANE